MEAISGVIYDFLAKNRRITVAGLGTFLTKGDRESVLFSEFIKSDDGVLRSLLVERGVSEEAAAVAVESFVVEVKSTLEGGGSYDFAPIGALRLVDGAIQLHKCEMIEQIAEQKEADADESMIDSIVDSIADSFVPHNQDDVEPYSDAKNPKCDVWLLAAMAAGAIALFVLLYGVAVDWMTGDISFGATIDGVLEGLLR